MSDSKPTAEVLAGLYANAQHRAAPDLFHPWVDLFPEAQANMMLAMTDIVEFLGLLGTVVVRDGGVVKLVRHEVKQEKKPEPKQVQQVQKPARNGMATSLSPTMEDYRTAKERGYEGDTCQECGQLTMVRNGSCLKCMSCGSTSGCS